MSKRIKPLSEAEKREMRRLFPFLVAMAKKKIPPMTYGQIGIYTGIRNRKWMGRALGNIRDPEVLYRLLEKKDRPAELPYYPDINSLAVNQTGAPGSEWSREISVEREYKKKKTTKAKIEFVRRYQMDVYKHRRWNDIISDLGLSDILFAYEKLLDQMRPSCKTCVLWKWNKIWAETQKLSQ